MRTRLNKYFGFSKREFNGLIFLISIIIVLKSIPIIYGYLKPVEKDESDLLAQIQKIEVTNEEKFQYTRNSVEDVSDKAVKKLFNFDPNTIDLAGWQKLGLSQKQAQSIVNYCNKGGKFYKPEDLRKMYTISAEMYQKLLPFVQIEKQNQSFPERKTPFEKKEYAKKELVIVDVNRADSSQLEKIKGIGPAFALRILKYRERLGGFHKKEQLMEIYGLDSVKYNEIKDQVIIDRTLIRPIHINTVTFENLKGNPYLTYKQINAILQYRKQHGPYSSLADLNKVAILNPQVVEKIRPYLTF